MLKLFYVWDRNSAIDKFLEVVFPEDAITSLRCGTITNALQFVKILIVIFDFKNQAIFFKELIKFQITLG